MRKKFLPLLLVFALALSLLPGAALETDAQQSAAYWVELTQEQALDMIARIEAKTETRDIVLVCCPAGEQSTIMTQFASHASKNSMKLYCWNDPDAEVLAGLFTEQSADWPAWPIVVTYNTSNNQSKTQENVITLRDPAGTITGTVGGGLLDVMEANGLGKGSSGADPEPGETPNPGPGDDPTPGGDPLPTIPDGMDEKAWDVLRLTNQHRMSIGLQPLSTFAELQDAANVRAEEIYVFYRSSHARPDGRDCWTAFTECGVSYHYVAENIASGQRTSASVMNSWLNSPGHRRNIETARLLHVGVGHYYGTEPSAGEDNWTQDFAVSNECRFSNLILSASTVPGKPGADLDTLVKNITVTATCYRHGTCRLPLIAAMCSGYDPNEAGDQTITVTYGGQTAQLTIAAAHNWDGGSVTTEPTCIEPGEMTYTCTDEGCGASRTETIPALGHTFTEGSLTCDRCGTPLADAVGENLGVLLAEESASPWTEERARQYVQTCAEQELRDLTGAEYGLEVQTVSFEPPVNGTRTSPEGEYGCYQYMLNLSLPESVSARLRGSAQVFRLDLPPVPYDASSEPPEDSGTDSRPSSSDSSSSDASYSIQIPASAHGQVSLQPKYAEAGKTVTLTAAAEAGYVLSTLTVTDRQGTALALESLGEGKFSFTMPKSQVTVKAVFAIVAVEPEPVLFADVSANAYYKDAVQWAVSRGITAGTGADTFGPDAACTRAQVVTFLWRAAGSPAPQTGENPFQDVAADAYYRDAVLWAAEQGITSGTGADTFGPDGVITRAQAAAFLYQAAGAPEVSGGSPFGDVSPSAYYANAVQWALSEGVTAGTSAATFGPDSPCTRAQIVTFLFRAMADEA